MRDPSAPAAHPPIDTDPPSTDPVPVPDPTFSGVGFLSDPGRHFQALADRPRFAAPLLLLMAGSMALAAACYARLDVAWFIEHVVDHLPGGLRPPHAPPARIDRTLLLFTGVLSAGSLTLLAWAATSGLIFFLASAAGRPLHGRQACALSAWARIPHIAALAPAAVLLALHPEGRLSPEQLDPTRLAALWNPPADPFWQGLAQRVSLADLWTCGLLALALRRVLRLRRWQAIGASSLVLLPDVVIASLTALMDQAA